MIDNNFNRDQYSQNANQYLANNINGDIGGQTPKQRAKLIQQFLPRERKIFEIGSASGNDALELKNIDYTVTASDYVDEFVDILINRGLDAVNFDAKKDNFPQTDAIYANAVFVHFTPLEVADCLKRAKEKLINEKIFFISVIKGDGYERSARGRGFVRDFYYYTKQSMSNILENEGYKIVYANDDDSKWLQIIAKVK